MRSTKYRVRKTRNGIGVIATAPYSPGNRIMHYSGKRYTRTQLPYPYDEGADHCLQIGRNLYIGPSGQAGDFVNHSCSPNAGLRITRHRVLLVAIAPIRPGDEITFDYSTTMDESGQDRDGWEMDCRCGSPHCRKRIRDFKFLPPDLQRTYIDLQIVPKYLAKKFARSATPQR